jgi:hypothetical protein
VSHYNEFEPEGFIEELRDHIASNSGLGYVVGTNLTVGYSPDPLEDFPEQLTASRNILTIYEAGGTFIRRARQLHQERTVRFLFRGNHPQDAVNRAWRIYQWFERSNVHFDLTSFSCRFLRTESPPTVVAAVEDTSALADMVLTYHVLSKVTS